MSNIKNASKIDLSNKGLEKIPSYIFECRNLKTLILSNNKIREIPLDLTQLKHLKNIDLSNNQISQVYAKTFDLINLKNINLSNNRIRSLPKQIGCLKKLNKLLLAGNLIEDLPREVGGLKNLKVLNISNNKLTVFPDSILKLTHLTHLWIGGNDFQEIPTEKILISLTNLKAIYCYNAAPTKSDLNKHIELLTKQRGNALNTIKLLEYRENYSPIPKSKEKQYKPQIFISYSHRDSSFKDEVEITLLGLKHTFPNLAFEYWIDTKIKSGDDWKEEIVKSLNSSSIAILLVSRHFLASEFIMKTEVPTILRKAEDKGTVVLSLIVGQCSFKKSDLGKFQAINNPNSPIKSLSDHEQDVVYTRLSDEVENRLKLHTS